MKTFTSPLATMFAGVENIALLAKIAALATKQVAKWGKMDPDKISKDYQKKNYIGKILGRILLGGGITVLLSVLAKKRIHIKVNKVKLKELDLLTSALKSSHTKEQKRMWDDIERITSESNKDLNLWRSVFSLQDDNGDYKKLQITNIIGVIIASKTEGKIRAKSKWVDIQTRKYEDSLNKNQTIIYKNIFETQYNILASDKILTSILSVGVPILVMQIIGLKHSKDIKAWERELKT